MPNISPNKFPHSPLLPLAPPRHSLPSLSHSPTPSWYSPAPPGVLQPCSLSLQSLPFPSFCSSWRDCSSIATPGERMWPHRPNCRTAIQNVFCSSLFCCSLWQTNLIIYSAKPSWAWGPKEAQAFFYANPPVKLNATCIYSCSYLRTQGRTAFLSRSRITTNILHFPLQWSLEAWGGNWTVNNEVSEQLVTHWKSVVWDIDSLPTILSWLSVRGKIRTEPQSGVDF